MTIKEVSEKYEISADTLRYYERIGLIPAVNRNRNGIRNYQEDDLNWVHFIKCMRSAGLSIENLIEYVSLFQQGDNTIKARKKLLIEQRQDLQERIDTMKETLAYLDKKIENYEVNVAEYEKGLKRHEKTK